MEVVLPLIRFLGTLAFSGIVIMMIMEDPLKFIFSIAAVGFTGLIAALMLAAPRREKKYEKLYEIAQGTAFFAVAALELYLIWF